MRHTKTLPEAALPPKPRRVLRVAVSGHRITLGRSFETSKVRSTCAQILDDLEAILAETSTALFNPSPPTFVLASALAEGADQIAVEALFERPERMQVQRRLEVVLPFAVDDYAATFESSAAAAGMKKWLEQASAAFVLADWTPPLGEPSDAVSNHRRDRRYATVGGMLVDQADILIAIWDGLPAQGRGGTAEVVSHGLATGKPILWIHSATGQTKLIAKPVFIEDTFQAIGECASDVTLSALRELVDPLFSPAQSHVARDSDHSGHKQADPAAAASRYLGEETVPRRTVWSVYHNLLLLRAKRGVARELSRPLPKALELRLPCDFVGKQLDDADWRGYPVVPGAPGDAPFAQVKTAMAPGWAAADAIATRMGHVYRSAYILTFLFGALAVVTGLAALVVPANIQPWFAAGEFILLAAAVGFYLTGRRQSHHRRWMSAREISEQMRAHWGPSHLALSGRRTLEADAPWTAWLYAAYTSAVGPPNLKATPQALSAIASAVRDGIVRDQKSYHQENAARLRQIHRLLERSGASALALALVSTAALTFLSFAWKAAVEPGHGADHGLWEHIHHWLILANGALPAIGAAIAGTRFQGDFERFADRSGETAEALVKIEDALDAFIDDAVGDAPRATNEAPLFERIQSIVLRLDETLLSDVDDWRFVYVARPSPEPG